MGGGRAKRGDGAGSKGGGGVGSRDGVYFGGGGQFW